MKFTRIDTIHANIAIICESKMENANERVLFRYRVHRKGILRQVEHIYHINFARDNLVYLFALNETHEHHNANTVSASYIVSVVYNLGKSIFTVYFTIGGEWVPAVFAKIIAARRYAQRRVGGCTSETRALARSHAHTYRWIYFHCGNRRDSQSSGYL